MPLRAQQRPKLLFGEHLIAGFRGIEDSPTKGVVIRVMAPSSKPILHVRQARHRSDLNFLRTAHRSGRNARVDSIRQPGVALLFRFDDGGSVDARTRAERVGAHHRVVLRNRHSTGLRSQLTILRDQGQVGFAQPQKIQIDQRAVQPCMKWETLQASANDINRRIEIALNAFGVGVDSRLREHSLTITTAKLDVVESYDYKEHAKDLVVLKNAQWCDAILAKPLI